MSNAFPPGLILILGALLMPVLGLRARQIVLLVLPLVALYLVWMTPDGVILEFAFLDYTIVPLQGDKLSRLFATVFSLMAFTAGLFAIRQENILELSSSMFYAGGAIGVLFAGDLITVFIFWELMAVGSTLVIWSNLKENTYKTGMRYIIIHLFGGVVLMAGIVAYVMEAGSITFTVMTPLIDTGNLGVWLILAGFLINAGAPPLSAWLPDAYPESSYTGMVVLSAFTTKTAVYVLIRGFPGTEVLIWIGAYMIFYAIIYALLENNVRRVLAYSIVGQVGFMVTSVGIGTELALNGASAHAFTHVIYKALLIMSAGAVLYQTGKRKCTDLGGLFQSMPVTCICGIVGAMAISAFPFTSGFISKSMMTQSAADQHLTIVWFALTAASAAAPIYIGLKFPWFVFFGRDSGLRPADPPMNMQIAMIFFAFLCIALGVYPDPLMALLPFAVEYVPYTASHVTGKLQLLLFGSLAFFILLPQMRQTLTLTLDVDWFWRRLGRLVTREFSVKGPKVHSKAESFTWAKVERFVTRVAKHHGPQGALARSWPTGSTVLWVVVLLFGYLVFYYV